MIFMVSRYALFIAFLVGTKKASLASNSTGARQLRGLSYMVPEIPVRNADDGPFLYRITIVSTFFEGEDGSILATEREKLISCIPIFGGQETDGLYAIKLPQTFLDDDKHANDIAAGKLFVSITNTELHNEEVMLAGDSVISVISDPRNMERAESASTMGTKTLAIVRISTKNAAPNDDADTLREGLFSPYKINLKTQFSACSFGKLEWVLAPHGERGVLEVFVDQPVSDFTSGSALVTAAQDTMKAKMGIDNAASLGDKVIMCLPPGTGGWVASSGVNHWRAQFNNEWCLSLTATMHETGHMLGLTHSNENGVAYGDSTGYMAAGHKNVSWPQKCFNGLENWQLGWYQNRQVTLDNSFETGHLIKIASFVDFNRTGDDEHVVVNIANEFYLQYNAAKKFNRDTEEKKDELTITAFDGGSSEGLAGLKESERYIVPNYRNTQRNLIIEACRKRTGILGADVFLVSVALNASLCDRVYQDEWTKVFADAKPAKTRPPTVAPTSQPSVAPTSQPSVAPRSQPSVAPSVTPTHVPTEAPSRIPTTAPTKAPTPVPTPSPSNFPSSLSLEPTKQSVAITEAPSDSPSPTLSPEPTSSASTGQFGNFKLFVNVKVDEPTPTPKIDYAQLLKDREEKMLGQNVQDHVVKSVFEYAEP